MPTIQQEVERLRSLVTQLINRLQNERDQRQQLAHQQLHEMKKKVDEMLSQFRDAGSAS